MGFDRDRFFRSFSAARQEVARAELLRGAAGELPGDAFVALVGEVYRTGDTAERVAVLRALPSLPDPARFVPLAVEACRSSVQPIFEAVAAENDFPARHFPELNFNQMVLKALFVGVAVDRIHGLDGRIGPELVRMAEAYASERRAAGRPVPDDVARISRRKP